MKTFWNVIGIWFLFQLIVISGALAGNSLAQAQGKLSCDPSDQSISGAIFTGMVFPLTAMHITKGEWCWEN